MMCTDFDVHIPHFPSVLLQKKKQLCSVFTLARPQNAKEIQSGPKISHLFIQSLLLTNFTQLWHVVITLNAYQRGTKLSTSQLRESRS